MQRRWFICALVLSLSAAWSAARTETRERLEILSGGGRHAFAVELAETPEERSQGLMFRRSLDPDAGMLFLYPTPRRISMWMKNTFISLDMLFIRRDGTIAGIAERTVPQSLDPILADTPVIAVLEVAGGTSERLGLAPGDRVFHRAFSAGR